MYLYKSSYAERKECRDICVKGMEDMKDRNTIFDLVSSISDITEAFCDRTITIPSVLPALTTFA